MTHRQLTPLLVSRIAIAAAQTRAFRKAEIVMAEVAGQPVSAKTIERVVGDVGHELAQRRDASPRTGQSLAKTPQLPPDLAVVECDGGRIRTREPGHGPGVHLSGKGWNETKNACLIRAQRRTFAADPQPDPPECFCDPKHVAKIAETEALSVASANPEPTRLAPQENEENLWSRSRTGVRSACCGRCSAAWPARRNSADKWRGKLSAGVFPKRPPKPSSAMACPGTGRSGSVTSRTSRRSWISSTC